jgi:serine/threonine protein kinase
VAPSPHLALELLEGETLAERVGREQTLPLSELLTLIDQVLDALAVGHERGVVDRDLKPGNLFLTTSGQVKILDFGMQRSAGQQSRIAHTNACAKLFGTTRTLS